MIRNAEMVCTLCWTKEPLDVWRLVLRAHRERDNGSTADVEDVCVGY